MNKYCEGLQRFTVGNEMTLCWKLSAAAREAKGQKTGSTTRENGYANMGYIGRVNTGNTGEHLGVNSQAPVDCKHQIQSQSKVQSNELQSHK